MRKNDDKKNLSHGFVISVGIGTAVGFLMILILFAIFAAIITSGKLSDSMMVYVTALCAFVGSLIGTIVAVKRAKGRIMTVSLSVGAFMFLITLIGSAFAQSGTLIGKMTPALFIAFILGAIAGGFLNIKRKKHKHA
jgi:putative membrane protein (TIGR04086 family)